MTSSPPPGPPAGPPPGSLGPGSVLPQSAASPVPVVPESSNADKRTRRRFSRRRRMRRLLSLRPLLIAVLVIGLASGAVWLVFFSDKLAVEKVEITGNSLVGRQEILKRAEVPMGEPLARVDTSRIAARLQGMKQFAAVEVSCCWPDTLCVSVREREAVAVVETEGKLRGMDESGILFRDYDAGSDRPSLPLVKVSPTTSIDAMQQAAQVVMALPAGLVGRIDHLDVGSVDQITLCLRRGATVEWGAPSNRRPRRLFWPSCCAPSRMRSPTT